MKTLLCLFGLAVNTALIVAAKLVDGKYPRLIDYVDENGVVHKVDLLAPVDMELLDEIHRNPANNEYHLFTRRNPNSYQRLINNDADSVTSSNFDSNHPTIVTVHGWQGNNNSNHNSVIKDAYLRKAETNVIVLDWRRLAVSLYPTAVKGVPAVGRGLGLFLNFLKEVTGMPFNNIHLIGFSLGSHLIGNAGRELGGRVARITGMDPAGPLWRRNKHRMRSSDGIYVEAIHTNGAVVGFGIGFPVADADFFPNGGKIQPGCLTVICHHKRAWELFASTLTHDHLVGRQCSNMKQVYRNKCNGPSFPMGNDYLNKSGSGLFRVNTGGRYPF